MHRMRECHAQNATLEWPDNKVGDGSTPRDALMCRMTSDFKNSVLLLTWMVVTGCVPGVLAQNNQDEARAWPKRADLGADYAAGRDAAADRQDLRSRKTKRVRVRATRHSALAGRVSPGRAGGFLHAGIRAWRYTRCGSRRRERTCRREPREQQRNNKLLARG